jgi:hypothetical protein
MVMLVSFQDSPIIYCMDETVEYATEIKISVSLNGSLHLRNYILESHCLLIANLNHALNIIEKLS